MNTTEDSSIIFECFKALLEWMHLRIKDAAIFVKYAAISCQLHDNWHLKMQFMLVVKKANLVQ